MVENAWKLVDAFFDEYKLVDHHIKSYNDFVNHRIQDIIDITEPIVLEQGEYTIKTGMWRSGNLLLKRQMDRNSKIFPDRGKTKKPDLFSTHVPRNGSN